MTRLLAALLTLVATAAQAQTPFPPSEPVAPGGPYAGVLFGASEAKDGCVGILSTSSGNCDAKDSAYGIFAGAQFHRYVGAEIGYINFGKVKASGQNVAADAWDVALVGFLPLATILPLEGSRLSLFARGGGYRATLTTSVSGVADTSNGGFTYGGGLQYELTQNIGVRALFERYKRVGRDQYMNNNYDVLGLSAFYRFR